MPVEEMYVEERVKVSCKQNWAIKMKNVKLYVLRSISVFGKCRSESVKLCLFWFLVNDQCDAQFFSMYLFLFLTLYMFQAHRAHNI